MDSSPPGYSVHGDSPGKNTGLGCYACLPPGDLPNPGIDLGLPHCRQILYHLSHQRETQDLLSISKCKHLLFRLKTKTEIMVSISQNSIFIFKTNIISWITKPVLKLLCVNC